jgi:prophage antirepressor-like protein|nr:MAG TPA: repressor domain protein [Caudoviricetes sp.]
MENLMIFEGHDMEVFEFDGQVLFNPKHVAEILGIADVKSSTRNFNSKQLIKVKNSDVHNMHFRKLNNAGENFLTESGVYKLIFRSHKPEAERFSDWVTDEVLPSIRKTGSYQKQLSPQEMMRIQLGMIDDHEDRIKNLESNMVIDYGQQQTLRQHVNKAVLNALGGKDTEAYAYISKVVFAECNRDLQDRFKVNSRNNIPRKRYEEAIDYVDNWEPKTNTKLRIDEYNRQQRFEV